jgi:hypothetical protein
MAARKFLKERLQVYRNIDLHICTYDVDEIPEIAQEEFIEIINDAGIGTEYSSFSEAQFGIRRLLDYPALALAFKILLPFPQPMFVKYDVQLRFRLQPNT